LKCGDCVFFHPILPFPNIGYCTLLSNVSHSETRACTSFRALSLSDILSEAEKQGYAYCVNCGLTLTSGEEIEEHYKRGHRVVLRPILGEEAYLETYAAD